jgi:phytoene dehydrogenase-like protein
MKQNGDEYEVIVVGSGLGGLVAAALLAYHHHKVLLLKESPYHPFYVKEGYRFVPFSNFSERRLRLALLQRISQALNLPFLIRDREDTRKSDTKSERPKQKVAFQVILPKARIDLFCHRSMLEMEWKREFPKELSRIENFYNEMDRIQSLLKKMKTEGAWSVFPLRPSPWIKRLFPFQSLPKGTTDEKLFSFSKEFREFIQLQLISWGNVDSDRFPIFLTSYLLSSEEAEKWVSNPDAEKMAKGIFEKFFQSGGTVEEIEGVEKIDIGWWRRKFTLVLSGGGKTIRSKFLILNSPLHRVSSFLGKREKLLSKWRKKIQPRYALLPIFLGIDEKVVPVGMRDLLVSILDLEKAYEGGNLLFLSLSQKGDETAAPKGKRALMVESLMPVEKWNESSLEEHLKSVMRHLHHLFPFHERYIEFTDWSWAKRQFSCWSYPHFLYETGHDFEWGEGVVPNRISRNLYFVGKENFPYLGIEGEVTSGWMIAKQVLEKYD